MSTEHSKTKNDLRNGAVLFAMMGLLTSVFAVQAFFGHEVGLAYMSLMLFVVAALLWRKSR